MKVLQLCNKVPFPPKDGGCIAMNNLTQGLIDQGCKVKVLAINTQKHFIEIEKLPLEYRSETNIEAVFVDTEVKAIPAFFNLFSNKSYNIERFYSKDFEEKLISILKAEQFDIVQLESLYVSMYVDVIRKYSKAKIVLRAHNIEHHLWEYNYQLANNPLKKSYLNILAKRLKKYELNSLDSFDSIITITKQDEYFFKQSGFLGAIKTAPFGIELEKFIQNDSVKGLPNSLFHIGAMDWQPNIEGVSWFLNKVWNKAQLKNPDLQLFLAGRNMRTEFKLQNIPNVVIVGEVENAYEFMRNNSMMIVPLLSGGGMRVKIIEGMALGKTIISTSIGAEGIEYENNKNIIIANTSDEFVEAISKCITDKLFAESIGNNARFLVENKYNNKIISKNLLSFYQRLIA